MSWVAGEGRGRLQSSPIVNGINWLGIGTKSASGVEVTPEGALSSTAVLAAIRRISQSVAMLPLPVYKRVAVRSRQKDRAPDHPLYPILNEAPNSEITAYEFREMMQASILVRGNAYAEIERNAYGQVVGLWPLRSDRTWPERAKDGSLWYKTIVNGKQFALPKRSVFHVKGFSTYGLLGICLIDLAREAIGTAIAQEKYQAKFFSNNAQPGGVIEHPGKLSDDALKHLKKSWDETHAGLDNAHRAAILEEGMKFNQTGISNSDAELIAGRTFQIQEVSRIFDIPPHLLAELSKATFTNIEHQSLEYVKFTLGPWLVRWEQRIDMDLLTPEERKEYFAEFLVEGLLRGDAKTRAEYYQKLFAMAVLSPNDIRDLENMNPIGPEGDVYLVPLNMGKLNELEVTNTDGGATEPQRHKGHEGHEERAAAGERKRLRKAYQKLLSEAGRRLVRAEVRDITAGVKKYLGEPQRHEDTKEKQLATKTQRHEGHEDPNMGGDARATRGELSQAGDSFINWVRKYYREDFPAVAEKIMSAPFDTYAGEVMQAVAREISLDELPELETFGRGYLNGFAARHADSSIGQMIGILQDAEDDAGGADRVRTRLEEWEDTRGDKIGRRESVRLGEAIAATVIIGAGYKLRWSANAGACPICQELDGAVVGRGVSFIGAGSTIDPKVEGVAPLTVGGDIGHGPLHDGCECIVVAE